MYKLQKADFYKASSILGETFNNYPIFTYIIPNSKNRKENLKLLCQFLINLGNAKGEVISTSNKLEGISIWLPSNRSNTSGMEAIQAGLLNLMVHLSPEAINRFIKVGSIKSKKRSEVIFGDYVICDMIGVDPRFQKQGFGRQIIENKLIEFDQANIPCYLETSKPENIEYYKRFKFIQIGEYKIQEVDVFCLKREPNPK
jgi:ribosomal protein S18 acetylase RimI-like enzyme